MAMNCSFCGTEIKPGETECSFCGTPVENAPAPAAEKPAPAAEKPAPAEKAPVEKKETASTPKPEPSRKKKEVSETAPAPKPEKEQKAAKEAPKPEPPKAGTLRIVMKKKKVNVCSGCGKIYEGGAKFCSECGGKIEAKTEEIPTDRAYKTVSSKVKACSKCGKEYSDSSKFCPDCGGKIESKEKFSEIEVKVCQKETYVCAKCGKQYEKNEKFCSECGGKIEKRMTYCEVPANPAPEKKAAAPAKKEPTPEKTAPAKKAAPAKKESTPAKPAPAKKEPAKKEPAKPAPAKKEPAKKASATPTQNKPSWKDILKGFLHLADNSNMYVRPNIPDSKKRGAINGYAKNVSPDKILVLYDDTVFGGADDGLIITQDRIYAHALWEDAVSRKIGSDTRMTASGHDLKIDGTKFVHLDTNDDPFWKTFAEAFNKMVDSLAALEETK